MHHHFDQAGVVFTVIALWRFSFSTFIGILYYARNNVTYLLGDKWWHRQPTSCLMLFIGGLTAYTFIWDLGDIGIGLMTIFNLIAILPMFGRSTITPPCARVEKLPPNKTAYKKPQRHPALVRRCGGSFLFTGRRWPSETAPPE